MLFKTPAVVAFAIAAFVAGLASGVLLAYCSLPSSLVVTALSISGVAFCVCLVSMVISMIIESGWVVQPGEAVDARLPSENHDDLD